MISPDQRHAVTLEGTAHATQPVAAAVMEAVRNLIKRQHAIGTKSAHSGLRSTALKSSSDII